MAYEGMQNVISSISDNCKIIFPSTHVVFEGKEGKEENIEEDYKKFPVLCYGVGKDKNEEQIKKSGKKYAILRLGSVYGYSNDAARIDIMPNFFSKVASQNGVIKLFSGGHQIKSLVPLLDVARCFKFMEENNKVEFEQTDRFCENCKTEDDCKKEAKTGVWTPTDDYCSVQTCGVEKNEINIDKTIDDFEFNQDNSIEFDEEYRSPGWNRYKKNKALKWKK